MAEDIEAGGVGVAATLLAAVSFMMIIMYLVNNKDDDIRRYTYDALSTTTSIFNAVLLFQSVNDLLKVAFVDSLPKFFQLGFNFVALTFWFLIVQAVLAHLLHITSPPQEEMSSQEFKNVKLSSKCFAILLAHITGFCAINFWASLQHLEVFSSSTSRLFLFMPVCYVGYQIFTFLLSRLRAAIALGDGTGLDPYEKEWDSSAIEAENDVVSLGLSFTLVQAIRAAIDGHLPNAEGKDEEGVHHSMFNALLLWLCGTGMLLFAMSIFWLNVAVRERIKARHEQALRERERLAAEAEAAGEEGSGEPAAASAPAAPAEESGSWFGWNPISSLVDTIASFVELEEEDGGSSSEEEEEEEEGFYRFVGILNTTFAMAFAWCSFYGWVWLLAGSFDSPSTQGVVLAMIVSIVSFSVIFALDYVADRLEDTAHAGQIPKIVRMVIKCIGLLIGFAWEQCFDAAVDVLAEASGYPHVMKVALAVFCAVLLIPAWRWYILPMVEHRGWKYGFVVHDYWKEEKLNKARTRLERHLRRREAPKFVERVVKPDAFTWKAISKALRLGKAAAPPPRVEKEEEESGMIYGTAAAAYEYLPSNPGVIGGTASAASYVGGAVWGSLPSAPWSSSEPETNGGAASSTNGAGTAVPSGS